MSDSGHYSRPVNRPLNDELFNNRDDDAPGRPYLGVCSDCGRLNSAHQGIPHRGDECPWANR